MAETKNVLLALETIEQKRDYIKINGDVYPVSKPDEYGAIQQFRIANLVEQAEGFLERHNELTEDEVKMLADMLNELVGDYILPTLPESVLLASPLEGGLTDNHKVAIVQAFSEAVGVATEQSAQPKATSSRARRSPKSTSAA